MKKVFMLLAVICLLVLTTACTLENNKLGEFYILRDVYELELLTNDDLKTIAYYYNKIDVDGFNPIPKNPENISEEDEKIIKKTYLNKVIKEPNTSIKRVDLYAYYGTYGKCIVLGITDSFCAYDYVIEDEYIIDGVSFYDFAEAFIMVFVHNESAD